MMLEIEQIEWNLCSGFKCNGCGHLVWVSDTEETH